ncbi:hypothetical protein BC830DRAFT_498517 [Chytriomyces sp. MP71]|nr:hypothetical protein BC830DRAFT_498517 [Chytriomyces sp. MP71]
MLRYTTAIAILLCQLTVRSTAFFWMLKDANNSFNSFSANMVVPQNPTNPGSYFIWIGLQSTRNSTNYQPTGNGVLQPVLTFGHSCAPHTEQIASPNGTWHVSGLYVNLGLDNARSEKVGCFGGDVMDVAPGDTLDKACSVQSGGQYVKDGPGAHGCTVIFTYDMSGQAQTFAIMEVELLHHALVDFDVTFQDIKLSTDNEDSAVKVDQFCTTNHGLAAVENCSNVKYDHNQCTIGSCVFSASPANREFRRCLKKMLMSWSPSFQQLIRLSLLPTSVMPTEA